ncbi:MAG: helix-turn-helix transcriptional regulator [Actinomycetota bacterium]|jgi:transcriptional regulator with XRE-family HTH domain|nr:helix-turn-helix transcriptional regulator [Actinomycetota bacterium]
MPAPRPEDPSTGAPAQSQGLANTTLAARIGRQLRQRRKALALTLAQVSERSTLSVSFLSAVENGTNLPSLPSLVRITDALETDLPTLLVAEGASRVRTGKLSEDEPLIELSHPELQLTAIALRFSPGDEPHLPLPTKDHDVFCYVVSGELQVSLDEAPPITLSDEDALDVRNASVIHIRAGRPTLSVWTSCPVRV